MGLEKNLELIKSNDLFVSFFNTVFNIIQYFILFVFIYYFVISVFGWIKRKDIPYDKFKPTNKFALVVAAHNEEAVIGNIVRNLKTLNYPAELYDIYVVADNCTDNTASISQKLGAMVIERFNTEKRGKGFALKYAFDKIFKTYEEYDAVCVFDADNLVSSNYLMEMNKQLSRGFEVVQGYIDSKNPKDSYIAASYSISFWMANRLLQLPRYYLGLTCFLGGTGFAISSNTLKEIGWDAMSLTEDLEYTLKLALTDKKVYWSHEAVVYDEKPLTLVQSWHQRKRWMQGTADCIFRYLNQLLKKAIKDKDFVALDCSIYLVYPVVILLNQIALIIAIVRFALFTDFDNLENILTAENLLTVFATLFFIYLNGIFIYLEGKSSKKIFGYFLLYPIYSLTWIPIIIQGFMDRNKKEWSHTAHTRSIDISELENEKAS